MRFPPSWGCPCQVTDPLVDLRGFSDEVSTYPEKLSGCFGSADFVGELLIQPL